MDKNTVADDALISTDIDRIIKSLSTKKRIEINAFARELGMKTEALKKWIDILEDEGYVRVEYRLLNEFVSWAGVEITPLEEEVLEKTVVEEEKRKDDLKEEIFPPTEYAPKAPAPQEKKEERPASAEPEKKEAFAKSYEPKHEDLKAQERMDRIMEKIGEKPRKEKPGEEMTKSIISSFSEEKSDEDLSHEEEILRETMAEAKKEKEPRAGFAIAASRKAEKPPAREAKPDQEMVSLRKSLSEYMDEIKVQKGEIEKLKGERAKLLSEAYLPLENRFKAAFDSIAERLLEKEGKIIEVKERLMELPGKVGEVEKVEAALRRIREEGRRALSTNREEMESLRKTLREEDSKIREDIGIIEKDIKSRKGEMADLAHTLSELESREQGLKKNVEELNRHLAEINEHIAASYAAVSQLAQTRGEIGRRLDSIKVTLDTRANEASESYTKLQDVRKAESVISEYLSDYQKKIADIEDYVKESEKELGKLREFAEVKYMRGYLKELDSVSTSYEQELEAVNAQEKSVEERIQEAQANLDSLLRESRTLVKSLEKKTTGKDFEKLASEIKSRQEAMVATVKEKSMEREMAKETSSLLKSAAQSAAARKPEKKHAKKAGKKKRK
ncbi:Chromosome partition protein Smc [uncultured archaeon]|nr:Chromosome partition protein Smc [uncultured archaeon]